ncbi:MAG TPA: M1 family aminopeptidase [Phototrophicaceae bacterium]|nr:M1 family aminopeptidase [Phototrophicaceae bacterium]
MKKSLCFWIAGLLLAACTSPAATPTMVTTTPTPADQTLLESTERDLHPITEQTAEATEASCASDDRLPATQHTVIATISYATHEVQVAQHVHLINRTGSAQTTVVFDVEANRFPDIFTLNSVNADLGVAKHDLNGRSLTLNLNKALAPGCTLDADLDFTLHVPPVGQNGDPNTGYFGYTDHQLNLAQWLPMLAYYHDGQWIVHDNSVIGEQVVVEVANWDVTLTVSDAGTSMVVAAPGTLVSHSGKTWHYTLANARDYSLSLSPEYQVTSEKADNNVSVELYSFGDRTTQTQHGAVDNIHQAVDAAAQALALYSQLYGSFPYDRFVVVQGDYPDGTEFSDLVFVGDQWFRTNTGTPQSYLTIITVHETSHQWWFARVGSDQALNPWMDEALAVYSEYVFYEDRYPDLKSWWWAFRVDAYVGKNYTGKKVDSSVYDFDTARDYINAVYLRGAHMLDDLRQDLGTDAFFDLLKRYASVGQNQVMTPDDFWALLTPDQLDLSTATRAKYFNVHP